MSSDPLYDQPKHCCVKCQKVECTCVLQDRTPVSTDERISPVLVCIACGMPEADENQCACFGEPSSAMGSHSSESASADEDESSSSEGGDDEDVTVEHDGDQLIISGGRFHREDSPALRSGPIIQIKTPQGNVVDGFLTQPVLKYRDFSGTSRSPRGALTKCSSSRASRRKKHNSDPGPRDGGNLESVVGGEGQGSRILQLREDRSIRPSSSKPRRRRRVNPKSELSDTDSSGEFPSGLFPGANPEAARRMDREAHTERLRVEKASRFRCFGMTSGVIINVVFFLLVISLYAMYTTSVFRIPPSVITMEFSSSHSTRRALGENPSANVVPPPQPEFGLHTGSSYPHTPTKVMPPVSPRNMRQQRLSGMKLERIVRSLELHLRSGAGYHCLCMHHLNHGLRDSYRLCAIHNADHALPRTGGSHLGLDQVYIMINPVIKGASEETTPIMETSLVCGMKHPATFLRNDVSYIQWTSPGTADRGPRTVSAILEDVNQAACIQMVIDEMNGRYACADSAPVDRNGKKKKKKKKKKQQV